MKLKMKPKKKVVKKTLPKKNVKKIVDRNGSDFFGILFWDRKWIEKIQELSGMDGAYRTEWQFHYWALVGRTIVDTQILDVALPLVAFNYPQEVGGASVEFDLKDVQEMSEVTREVAELKAQSIMDSDFMKTLEKELHISEWNLVSFNSIHAHPTGVNSFSGTD